MSGPILPVDGYITDNARQEGEFKQSLDDTLNVLRRMIGAAQAQTAAILVGVLAPTSGFVFVDNEGQTSADNLDTITSTPYADGSIVRLMALTPASTTTIRHNQGVGGIVLKDAVNWGLTSSRWIVLRYDATSTKWQEVERGHGVSDKAGERSDLGLGSVAVLADGAVDAATLGGIASTGFYQTGSPVGDADTLDGLDSTAFMQLAGASTQTVTGPIQVDAGSMISNIAVGTDARFAMHVGGVQRGLCLFHDNGASSFLTFRIYGTDGTTILREFKFAADGAAPSFTGTGAKTFQMVEDLPLNVIGGTFTAISASGSIAGGNVQQVGVGRRAFMPDLRHSAFIRVSGTNLAGASTWIAPRIGLLNTFASALTYDMSWEFFIES